MMTSFSARVAAHFAAICTGAVEIYPLDNLLALKIVLNGALVGGRIALIALGILVIGSLLMLIGNILSDVIYAIVDPRIRFK